MDPVAHIGHDIKILQVQGLGKDGEGIGGVPATVLNTGLAVAGVTPFLKEALGALAANPDARALTGLLGGAAKGALRETTKALTEGISQGMADPEAPKTRDPKKD